jgi:HTH-type transcriptional regulator, glycine betaine synthesis regulator
MKGHVLAGQLEESGAETDRRSLASWEMIAIDAVGNVIEFWGFKRNQGRVWALLYLRDETLSAATIETQLGLSKGGVSMLLRDLEHWGVIRRVRAPGESAWRYRAETELVRMVTRVVEKREAEFIARVRADLSEARRLANEAGDVPARRLVRLNKMMALADATEKALKLFIRTARLDVGGMFGIFREGVNSLRRGK